MTLMRGAKLWHNVSLDCHSERLKQTPRQQTNNRLRTKMKKQILKTAIVSCALALASVTSVNAVPTAAIRYSINGTTWTTVADNAGGDSVGADGFMNVSILAGSWSLQVAVGLAKPIVGSTMTPVLDVSVTGATTGAEITKLWVEFSDTGFGPFTGTGAGSFYTSVGGNLAFGNSEVFSSRVDSANVLFGAGTLLTSLNATGTPFSEQGTAGATGLTGPFSVTISHVFTSGGGEGVISTDGRVVGVGLPDGGSSLALLGLSLLGLAGLRRKA